LKKKHIIVIGGGAAGFFAAINAAQKNASYRVTIIEKTGKILSKVRVSGGGRCNVTHACFDTNLLVKNYPRGEKELRSIFSKFSAQDTINWFEQRGVFLKTESDGRMFPATNNSETIVNCFLKEANQHHIEILLNHEVEYISKNHDHSFTLTIKNGTSITCDTIIVTTGGNAKESGYNWLQKTGHSIKQPVPSLFTFNLPNQPITKLMGVSVPNAKVKIAYTKIETNGPLLITHWGLSGPAILKASAWGARELADLGYSYSVYINWLPKYNEEKLRIEFSNQRLENPAKTIVNSAYFELPKRLWEYLLEKTGIKHDLRWADLSKKQMNVIIQTLLNDEYQVQGKTTFKEEFVTCGGINLKEIDLSTMQSRIIPNLFFAGEVIDVDGITGGFNFQNAWSTAWVAAQNI
jgi:predicted Rossmann fold flavoprotein